MNIIIFPQLCDCKKTVLRTFAPLFLIEVGLLCYTCDLLVPIKFADIIFTSRAWNSIVSREFEDG